MSTPVSNPYGPEFTQLSPAASYRETPRTFKTSGRYITAEPSLILLLSWMNAAPKHVRRYLLGLEKIFPTSRILLISTTSSNFLVQSKSGRLRELQPALDILKDLQPQETVLMYSFSNGGATTASLIAMTYRTQTKRILPISKMILDSAPGRADATSAVTAFAMGLPKSLVPRLIGVLLLRVVFAMWYLYDTITFTENVINRMRRELNDKELFPLPSDRLYIYSKEDHLVSWKDVEAHASDSRRIGHKVQELLYTDSGHVAHVLKAEARYWTAVEKLWSS